MELADLNWLAGPDEVSVTTSSKTLAELGVSSFDRSMRVLRLVVQNEGVSWAYDEDAVSGVNDLPAGVHRLPIDAGRAKNLEFIADSGTIKMSVCQEGPADRERA